MKLWRLGTLFALLLVSGFALSGCTQQSGTLQEDQGVGRSEVRGYDEGMMREEGYNQRPLDDEEGMYNESNALQNRSLGGDAGEVEEGEGSMYGGEGYGGSR